MYLILLAIVVIIILLPKLYLVYITEWCRNKVCLKGKSVIITGANAGIGFETALEMAKRGARVILACRNKKLGTEAVAKIIKLTANKDVVLKLLDLSSFQSVRTFADDIIRNEPQLDILINNAGAIALGSKISEDGLELEWQTNHFGPVLLTLLLLDLLKKSQPSRIINVASIGAKYSNLASGSFNSYDGHYITYYNTKLANIFFTQQLAKKLKNTNVTTFSVHPGVINTELLSQRYKNLLLDGIRWVAKLYLLTPEEGAQGNIYTATEQDIENLSGSHFDHCHVIKPYETAKDLVLSQKIWEETLRLIKYDQAI